MDDQLDILTLLQDPSKLENISLETLVDHLEKYPASPHLHLLHAIKSLQIKGHLSQEIQEKLAIYFPDRRRLARWMDEVHLSEEEVNVTEEEMQVSEEASLDISTEPQQKITEASSDESLSELQIHRLDTDGAVPEKKKDKKKKKKKRKKKKLKLKVKKLPLEKIIELYQKEGFKSDEQKEPSQLENPEADKKTNQISSPLSYTPNHADSDHRFLNWLRQLELNKIKSANAAEGNKKLQPEIADESLKDDDEIVSEDLADLLAQQGHFEEAIRKYQQLMLIYPEKSALFASKIKNLKKN